jgi:hypothetical protein
LVIQSKSRARDPVCTGDPQVTVDSQEQGWTAVVGWHRRNRPHVAKPLAK